VQGEVRKVSRFVERIQQIHLKVQDRSNLIKESQQQLKPDMTNTDREDHKICIGDKARLDLHKERLRGASNKLKPLRYRPFNII